MHVKELSLSHMVLGKTRKFKLFVQNVIHRDHDRKDLLTLYFSNHFSVFLIYFCERTERTAINKYFYKFLNGDIVNMIYTFGLLDYHSYIIWIFYMGIIKIIIVHNSN